MKVKTVILFQNGMLCVFDEDGAQIPELQGRAVDVLQELWDLKNKKKEEGKCTS